jgi:hypothetical protein
VKKLSSNVKILIVSLLIFVFLDFLISPVVFETRASELLSNASSLRWLVLLFSGLILNIISIVVLLFRPRIASLIAVVGSLLWLVVAVGDLFGLVTPLKAPAAVSIVEVIATIELIGVFILCSMVYRETTRKNPVGVLRPSKSVNEGKQP